MCPITQAVARMNRLSLNVPSEVQWQLARAVRERREARGWSRRQLSERSTVPEATIKKFELTGPIALHQFILLWHCVEGLERLEALAEPPERAPRSIDEVLGR